MMESRVDILITVEKIDVEYRLYQLTTRIYMYKHAYRQSNTQTNRKQRDKEKNEIADG